MRPAVLMLSMLLTCAAIVTAACNDEPTAPPDAAASDTLAQDVGLLDGLAIDGPGADAQAGDAQPGDSAAADAITADAITADAGAPTKTPCGSSLQCNSVTEVCVVNEAQLKTYVCKPVPTGCEKQRTCTCLGAAVCTGVFKLCNNNTASNTVTCSCPNC